MPGIAPGAVAGDCIQRVLEGRAQTTRRSLQEVTRGPGQSIVEALRRPRRHRRTIGLPRFRQPNRFQGKPSRSTATLKPRSNTSPAPHDLTPPAGDVATAVFVRCGSADVWVSRSRSRAGEGVGVGLADLPGLRQDRDGETGGLSAAEPDVQVDTVGLVQGDVVDEADGACAVPLRRVGVGPECGEICC